MAPKPTISRREFVKDTGGLLIGFSLTDSGIVPRLLAAASPESFATPSPSRLDAWLRIGKDGIVHVFTGKPEIGMGVETAYAQIVAEELDVSVDHVDFVLGDTARTANQGGVGGSTSIMMGAKPLRNAAANARYLLTQLASSRLGAPPEQLQVKDGIVSVIGDASKKISYADLASAGELNDALKVSGEGFGLNVEGAGKPKDPSTYTIVGKSAPRVDLPPKILGKYKYVTDVRAAAPKASKETLKQGDAPAALASAAKKLEATYECPFQSHATMGPGCAVADVHVDGVTTVWSGGQKPHDLQKGFSQLLRVPIDTVRVIWMEDAGSYGRPGFEDAAADAVLLSQAVGKPVRVQWTREDMTAWGSKGPAVLCDLSAGLDAQGEVSAVQFTSRAFSGGETHFRPDAMGNYLGAQLTGIPNTTGVDEFAQWGVQAPPYSFRNIHAVAHVIPALYGTASPLRTTHLRDPEGPATSFAVESFVDEIAAAAGVDPLDFRLKYLDEPRAKAVLIAAAQKAGWDRRPSPKKNSASGEISTGRGIGLSTRNGTFVGTVAEVEVNRRTGAVHVKRFVCAHDCGLIINPDALRTTIEANLIQSMSRSLMEEVMFDRSKVTSVDWRTYPVARASDIPSQVEVVLLSHPELPSSGAGEPSSRNVPAAIANAVFDATGARVRQIPLTPARVKAALASNQRT